MVDWNQQATFDAQYREAIRRKIGLRGYHRRAPAHYHWCEQQFRCDQMMTRQLAQPGWASVQQVAVIGAGFGWTAEFLAAAGIEAIPVDLSDYIANNWNVSEEAELRAAMDADPVLLADGYGPGNNFFDVADCFWDLSTGQAISGAAVWAKVLHPAGGRTTIPPEIADLSTSQGRNAVKNRFTGKKFDAVVSELVLGGHDIGDTAGPLDFVASMDSLAGPPSITRLHFVEQDVTDTETQNARSLNDWGLLLAANGFGTHYLSDTQGNWLRADQAVA